MLVVGHDTRKELRKFSTCSLDPIKTRRGNLNYAEIKTEQLSRNEVRHRAIRTALERDSFSLMLPSNSTG